jgi:transcriptional regulator with XRE-family HTH domain
MKIGTTATTDEILEEIGVRLRRYRLQQDRSIAELAKATGLTRRTLERAERGSNPTLNTLVRVLRALDRLDSLDAFLPPPLVSPLDLARLSGRERQRASRSTAGARDPDA